MSTSHFADRAPDVSQLTAYDESHLADYLRLLDAAVNAGIKTGQAPV